MNFYKLALEAALAAGNILKNDFFSQSEVEGKGKHDIVTQTDKQSEKAILKILQEHYPKHTYITEESGTFKTNSLYSWYIDPLDGTSHFVTGNPYFSVSIALAYGNEIIVAVVYNPILNELYTAEKGKGALLNNVPIHVNSKKNLSDAIIASAYSANETEMRQGLQTIEKLALHARKVLVNFSPAMDLCNTARGKLDGVVTKGTTPEDHAAGSLILKEAGGKVENFENEMWDVNQLGILATNGYLQRSIAHIVK